MSIKDNEEFNNNENVEETEENEEKSDEEQSSEDETSQDKNKPKDEKPLIKHPPGFGIAQGFSGTVFAYHNQNRWTYQAAVAFCVWLVSLGTFVGVCMADHPTIEGQRFLETINWWELSILLAGFIFTSWVLFSFQGVKHSRTVESLSVGNFTISTLAILAGAYVYGHYLIPAFITPDFGFFIGFVIVSPMVSQIMYQKYRNQGTMMITCIFGMAHIYHLVQIFPNFVSWLTGAK